MNMVKEKGKSFVFYESFRTAIDLIETDSEKLEAYKAIVDYGLNGEDVGHVGVVGVLMEMVKPNIDANVRKRESGRKGGRARKEVATEK